MLFNTFFGGDGGDAQKPIDKIDELDIKVRSVPKKMTHSQFLSIYTKIKQVKRDNFIT